MNSTKLTIYNKDYNIFYVESTSAVLKTIKKNKLWEKKIITLFEKYVSATSVVIDVGAFIGTHTIILSNLAKKVIAFEPQKLIGQCLKKTIEENNITNVEFYNMGLSNNETTLQFWTNNDGGATLVDGKRTKHNKKLEYIDNYNIEVVELDKRVDEQIDLIKIDAEGHEFEVLEGAKKTINKYKPILIIEVFKKNKRTLEAWCKLNNYECISLKGDDFLLKYKIDFE